MGHKSGVVLGVAVGLLWPATAQAACPTIGGVVRPAAIADAVVLSGPVSPEGRVASPARVRVLRYSHGRGPRNLRVATGNTRGLHGVSATLPGAASFSVGESVRLELTRGQLRTAVRGGVLSRVTCGRARTGLLRAPRGASLTFGAWTARVLAGRGGVRCLKLRGRAQCDVLRGRHAALVVRRTVGERTAVTAWGPRLSRVEVTLRSGDAVRARAGDRPPLFVAGPPQADFDVRVELTFADGAVRVDRAGAARRAFADDTQFAARWTATRATLHGATCAVYDPVGFEAFSGDTCAEDPPNGLFAIDTRDPARTIVYGAADPTVSRVALTGPAGTVTLQRAPRGGAFIAVLSGTVDLGSLTLTIDRPGGRVSITGQRSGTF